MSFITLDIQVHYEGQNREKILKILNLQHLEYSAIGVDFLWKLKSLEEIWANLFDPFFFVDRLVPFNEIRN